MSRLNLPPELQTLVEQGPEAFLERFTNRPPPKKAKPVKGQTESCSCGEPMRCVVCGEPLTYHEWTEAIERTRIGRLCGKEGPTDHFSNGELSLACPNDLCAGNYVVKALAQTNDA